MSIHTSTSSLERLAQMIDFDLGDVDSLPTGESAQILKVTNTGEIALRSLDGEHPFDALMGFDAPPDWEVFGVVAPGWGSYYEGPRKGERRRVRVIFVASRQGEEASVLRFAGDDAGTVMTDPQAPGRVADCVRRALDIPTPEPEDGSLVPFWFDRTLQRLVARRHPSNGGVLVGCDDIDAIIGEPPQSWDEERWKVVEAGGNIHMDGAVATWMDEGMLARFMLATMSEPAIAMPAARAACTPDAWDSFLREFIGRASAGLGIANPLADDYPDDFDDDADEPF